VPLSCNTIGAPKPKADVLADEDELLLKREVLGALTGTRGYSRVLGGTHGYSADVLAGGDGRHKGTHDRRNRVAVDSRRCNKIRVRTLPRIGQRVTLRSRFVCLFASVYLFVCFGVFVCLLRVGCLFCCLVGWLFVSLRFVCLCVYVFVCLCVCLFLFVFVCFASV
jgi:hypothetical protein